MLGGGIKEQWVYGGDELTTVYVYLEDGKMTSWQESK